MTMHMDTSTVLEGKWNQLKGKVQETWGDLTDDDLDRINGRYEQLVGTLQERYGYSRQRAESEVNTFLRQF